MTPLAPPDAETAVVTFLDAAMTGCTVATKVPNPRPAGCYGRVTSIGGTGRNLIQADPRLLLEFWDDDEQGAFEAAQMAWALLWSAQDSFMTPAVYVTQVTSTLPVNFPDQDSKSPRYQFISTLTASLTPLEVQP